MGSFIQNSHVYGRAISSVKNELSKTISGDAYLVESAENWVTIYPDDSQAPTQIAQNLSSILETGVLATFVHDDDVLYYTLYENGELVDEFNSNPLYFSDEDHDSNDAEDINEADGSPLVLLKYALPGTTAAEIRETLDETKLEMFASEGLTSICHLLGIDQACARASFRYIQRGELIPFKTLIALRS